MSKLNRRTLLVAAGITAAVPRAVRAASDPFQLGVASGDPRPDGMVLWTRLAAAPLDADGGMGTRTVRVDWEIATDARFVNIVQTGRENAVPADGHSVHVEPRGLAPNAWYFYRFKADRHISPVGRTRTAPARGASVASLEFAFASCQHFEVGWYHAHRYITADNPDVVLFLGDYMYEKPSRQAHKVRRYVALNNEANTLSEYRIRYAQHHLDPDLKACHAAAPWLVVFDDHEVKNNWYGVRSAIPEQRRKDAFRAFWENMPLPKAMKPTSAAIKLYRRIEWGTLARFHMMDTRQHRNKQAPARDCGKVNSTTRTLTGPAQEQWLLDGLTARGSGWDFLGQQVFFAHRDYDGDPRTCDGNNDSWDGYRANRARIIQGWIDRTVRNPVVLTGDVHTHWANDLRLNRTGPIVGTELVTSSITSKGRNKPGGARNNPGLNFIGNHRGYVRVTVNAQQLTAEWTRLSSIQERDPAKVTMSVSRRYVVLDGQPGLTI
ncbi:alkaline phosphatase D family protein [Kibdelosporangium aridum]|uniref:Alkaline phosphatase D n=1 Tax=Kibdelosporangium aridum TaxID=2030 RepID=A0A1W2G0U4_KIBAR|nr:alkaline phosphatase D family protein [Kibdelosporangium aridum]SMD27251.1 alkaline phosphatase D [Kibdelosporangium aridum]SMD27454.1 alkaline phosphatase D [Kibdelosporangium aridum]SMD27619.1 alkaline phosphatase D [Kibdelosporangium aridum]SMD27654.1 alkaline phosphatase D [Kibdelosporangium aridum]